MSHESNPQVQADLPEKRRLGIAPRLSAAAMIALSLSATAAANSGEQPNPNNVSIDATANIGDTKVTGHADAGLQDIAPGATSVYLPGVRFGLGTATTEVEQRSGSYVEQHSTKVEELSKEIKAQLMEWARLFDADPKAKETLDAELGLKEAVAEIEALQAAGWEIEDIILHGFASDDDETAWQNGGDNPGFGIDSEKNVRLAEKRAKAVASLLRARLQRSSNPALAKEVVIDGGSEVHDDDLAAAITQLAHSKGESTQDLVVRYNRDRDSFSAAELRILDGLRDDRYVSIKIIASKESTSTTYKWVDGEWVSSETQGKEFSIVLIPMLIPILRLPSRKPKAQTPTDEPPLAPPVLPPLPPTTRTYGPERRERRKKSSRVRQIGHVSQVAFKQKQPGQHNNGGGSGSRGQRSIHPHSSYMRNKTR